MDDVMESGAAAEVVVTDLSRVREMILRAYPDSVEELIAGDSVDALLDAVEPARAAFAAVRARVEESIPPAKAQPPVVPAGASGQIVDPATLPAHELIRRGLATRR